MLCSVSLLLKWNIALSLQHVGKKISGGQEEKHAECPENLISPSTVSSSIWVFVFQRWQMIVLLSWGCAAAPQCCRLWSYWLVKSGRTKHTAGFSNDTSRWFSCLLCCCPICSRCSVYRGRGRCLWAALAWLHCLKTCMKRLNTCLPPPMCPWRETGTWWRQK